MSRLQNSYRAPQYYVPMMLLVFPLFMWPFNEAFAVESAYIGMTSKKMLFHVYALAFFVATLALEWAFRPADREERQPLTWERLKEKVGSFWLYLPDVFLILFFVGALITWVVSPYGDMKNDAGQSAMLFGDGRFDGLLFLLSYGLVYLLVAHFCRFSATYLKAFSVVLLIMVLIAVVQLSGCNFLEFYPPSSHKGWYQNFVSTIGNIDIMGGFLCCAVPLVGVGYVVYRLNRWFTALFLITHTVSIYVMFSIGVDVTLVTLAVLVAVMAPLLIRNRRYVVKLLELGGTIVVGWWASMVVDYQYLPEQLRTQTLLHNSRATPIALIGLVILAALWYVAQNKEWMKKVPWHWVRRSFAGAELLLLAGAFCYFRYGYQPAQTSGLMHDLYELARFQLSDTAGTHRVGIWRHCIAMSKDNLVFGTGCGTLADTFQAFAQKTGYSRYADGSRILDFAHNEYVHYLCTQGLWGLLSYLGFLGSMAWLALKNLGRNPRILVLGSGVFGFCVQVFFSFSVVIVAPFFWLLLGLLMAEIRITVRQQKEEERQTQEQEEPSSPVLTEGQ